MLYIRFISKDISDNFNVNFLSADSLYSPRFPYKSG